MMNAEPNIGISWSGACEYDLAQGKGCCNGPRAASPRTATKAR